jgi:hypothetical protein
MKGKSRIIQGAPKTPDGFWNLKISVPATRRFQTGRHHVQRCLEFSWDGALVDTTPYCGSELFIKTECYSYTGWFPTSVSDLAVPDYFLWGYVKTKVYETRPDWWLKAANSWVYSLRKCYNVLWQPFRRDCSSVLNDMVVTYKVSYSNSNDSDEFSWTWNVPDILNKLFPLCPKKVTSFQKASGVFGAPCILRQTRAFNIFFKCCIFRSLRTNIRH